MTSQELHVMPKPLVYANSIILRHRRLKKCKCHFSCTKPFLMWPRKKILPDLLNVRYQNKLLYIV